MGALDCDSDARCGWCGKTHSAHHDPSVATCPRFRKWEAADECDTVSVHSFDVLLAKSIVPETVRNEIDRMRTQLEAAKTETERLRKALQHFAKLRVEATASLDGPDVPHHVGIACGKHAVCLAIKAGIFDTVIPARFVYEARRALSRGGER